MDINTASKIILSLRRSEDYKDEDNGDELFKYFVKQFKLNAKEEVEFADSCGYLVINGVRYDTTS